MSNFVILNWLGVLTNRIAVQINFGFYFNLVNFYNFSYF